MNNEQTLAAYRAHCVARAVVRHDASESPRTLPRSLELAVIRFAQAMPDAMLFPSSEHLFLLAARGVSPEDMLAQRIGKVGGTLATNFGGREIAFACAQRVGPTSGLLGNHMTHAAGFAWAMRMRGEASAVLTTMPRAAADSGDFHSAVNFAGAVKAPCVFLVVPDERTAPAAIESVAAKSVAYGIEGIRIGSHDLSEIGEIAEQAFSRAALERKPMLIELAHAPRSDDDTFGVQFFTSRAEHFAFLAEIENTVSSARQRVLTWPEATSVAAQQSVFATGSIR